jgi:hypothetical protein
VALPGLRLLALDPTCAPPWLRKLIAELPKSVLLPPDGGIGFVFSFDLEGNVHHNLQNPEGGFLSVTRVNDWNGRLVCCGDCNPNTTGHHCEINNASYF